MPEAPRRPTKRAQHLRNNATDAERLLWLELRQSRLGGYKFSRQIPIGPFICDFVCRRAKLVVELDGGQHSANATADAARTAFIEKSGYHVLRFWNNDVVANMEGVLQTIMSEIAACPPPNPLPAGEGGLGPSPQPFSMSCGRGPRFRPSSAGPSSCRKRGASIRRRARSITRRRRASTSMTKRHSIIASAAACMAMQYAG